MDLELWKKIKKEKGITIEEIAQKANLPKGTVQNIFCGYVPNPRINTIQAIEKALGITEETITLSEKEIKLINTIRKLPQNKQDLAISTFCNSLELLNSD